MGLIVRLIVHFLAALISLYIVNLIFRGGSVSNANDVVSGLGQSDLGAVLIFTIILMLLNTFLKPVLEFLAFPLNCLTFGLFSLVISAIVFWGAAALAAISLPDPKFISALVGAVVMGIVSGVLGIFIQSDRR